MAIVYLSGRSGEGALLEEREGSTSSKHDEDSLGEMKKREEKLKLGEKRRGEKLWRVKRVPQRLPPSRARPMQCRCIC
jgi:hypothetical protein